MYSLLSIITKPFTGGLETRIRHLLRDGHTYPGVDRVISATPEQKRLGIDLVVHIKNKQINLQLQPSYATAHVSTAMTRANVAVIVANGATPQGLLVKKLREGLDYFKY